MFGSFKQFFKKHLSIKESRLLSHEELQAAFKSKYQHFRALLTANNSALEAMAEMEQAIHGGQTYSMAFVRTRTTTVMVSVYKMVRHLLEMSEGRYHRLKKSYEKISNQIETILEDEPAAPDGELVISLEKVDKNMADQVGEKMAHLGEIASIPGFDTPPGFVVTAAASRIFFSANQLQPEIIRLLQLLDPDDLQNLHQTSSEIHKLVVNSTLPPEIENQIHSHYRNVESVTEPGIKMAVRSSALGEDLAGASFAGQYHSELNVDKEFLSQAYKEVIAGKYTARAIVYRLKRGYRDEDVEMCVGCLTMVEALISGVIYSRDPTLPRSKWVNISVVSGPALHVVDGSEVTDHFLVDRKPPYAILEKELRRTGKNERREHLREFTSANSTSASSSNTLSDEQAAKLTKMAIALEEHFGAPQDIEWSIDIHGKIQILQSRPILPPSEDTKALDSAEEKNEEPGIILQGGITGNSGVASGPIFKVRNSLDMLQFPRDAVLVVEHPLPEWAPLLNLATALVAETGSEAGHLATVSREFGIPALLSLDHALKKLDNDEVVTVDASTGCVYRGRRDDLLTRAKQAPNLMAGSPVERTLKEVLQHITPLNLTDPGSPYFKSSWCETMHDITRFCHEKSVVEMFDFGKNHHFDKRAAKRLVGDVPMEWWVIDLADGFKEGVDPTETTIGLGDILSIPMLAIWEGMIAFPWEGPPPVSASGMGSILFQSTMQPGFDPAVATPLVAKNYFLISKNFCNLSVRLGYHFAMLEAYLGSLRTERYVNFTFKGGAADDNRKAVRVELLADILDLYEFRVERKNDSLSARVEKMPVEFLKERLKILGYLTLHARQIDMAMGNQDSVKHYKEKFASEIATLLNQSQMTM